METGEQLQLNPVLEKYLSRHYGPNVRGKEEPIEERPEEGFYRLKRELRDPDFTRTQDEEVFLNSLTGDLVSRRMRESSPHVQIIEVARVGDHRIDLVLTRHEIERRDIFTLGRKRVDTYNNGSYEISEQAGKGRNTNTGNHYRISYADYGKGIANRVNVLLYETPFDQERSADYLDLVFHFEKDQILYGGTYENKKKKAGYGQPITVGSNSFTVDQTDGQREINILLGDGLIRTLSFPANIDLPGWFSQMNREGDEWVRKSQEFPVSFGVRTDPSSHTSR